MYFFDPTTLAGFSIIVLRQTVNLNFVYGLSGRKLTVNFFIAL